MKCKTAVLNVIIVYSSVWLQTKFFKGELIGLCCTVLWLMSEFKVAPVISVNIYSVVTRED